MSIHPSSFILPPSEIAWERPLLVGCCPSSGSTLLSVMLDAHPDLLCGPELSIFVHPLVWQECGEAWRRRLLDCLDLYPEHPPREQWDLEHGAVPYLKAIIDIENLSWYGLTRERLKALILDCDSADDLVRGLLGPALLRRGKRFWAEKSPPNIYAMPLFLARYPKGKAVVMARDGRDVVCSLIKRGFTLCEACSIWLVETTLSLMLREHPRIRLVRYEDLVGSPARVLADLAEFLELPPAGDVQLHYHEHSDRVASDPSLHVSTWTNVPTTAVSSSAVGRWKRDLTAAELEVFYRHRLHSGMRRLPGFAALPALATADLLRALDYETPVVRPVCQASSLDGALVDLLVRERVFSSAGRGARGLHRTRTELVIEPELRGQVLTASQTVLEGTAADLQDARRDLRDAQRETEVLKARLFAAQERTVDLEESLRQSTDRCAAAEAALEDIISSRSWRVVQRLRRYKATLTRLPWAGKRA